jgi:hypothetical protein
MGGCTIARVVVQTIIEAVILPNVRHFLLYVKATKYATVVVRHIQPQLKISRLIRAHVTNSNTSVEHVIVFGVSSTA